MLSARQEEIITGSLLGDGTIWTNFKDPLMKYQLSQSKLDKDGFYKKSYLAWYVSEFMEIGCSVRPKSQRGKGITDTNKLYHYYVFNTKCYDFWEKIEKKWYVPRTDHNHFKRTKIVPNDIRLSPLTLTIWHMEDGTNNAKDANIELNTQCFGRDEINFLIERLSEDLDLKASEKMDRGKRKIFVGRKSYFDFINMVKPHVEWDCFAYKTDTSGYTKKPHKGETHSNSKLTESQVDEIFKLRDSGMLQKDIAKQFNVSKATISLMLSGDRWGRNGKVNRKPRLTQKIRQQIINMKDQSQKVIAETLGVHPSTVSRILK